MISDLYKQLKQYYIRLDPHAETWDLWIKGNKTPSETFEVAVGTILVQNTNWRNVNKAIVNLKKNNVTSFKNLNEVFLEKLEQLIRPAGFYKQKALYLKSLSELFLTYSNSDESPSRQELLNIKGIGKETADSILVYCFQQPVSIVWTYTRRFLARFQGEINYLKLAYDKIQKELVRNLKKDFEVLGRFHALVVCHGQNLCLKKSPRCSKCFLLDRCLYGQQHKTNPKIAHIQTIITEKTKRQAKKKQL